MHRIQQNNNPRLSSTPAFHYHQSLIKFIIIKKRNARVVSETFCCSSVLSVFDWFLEELNWKTGTLKRSCVLVQFAEFESLVFSIW